jgi:hypothetical protein
MYKVPDQSTSVNVKYLSGDCPSGDNKLKSLKERISAKFGVGVSSYTATRCTQYAVHTLLFDIILSPTYFVSDGASIREFNYSFVFSLPHDGFI